MCVCARVCMRVCVQRAGGGGALACLQLRRLMAHKSEGRDTHLCLCTTGEQHTGRQVGADSRVRWHKCAHSWDFSMYLTIYVCCRSWTNIYTRPFESTHHVQRGLIRYRTQLCLHPVPFYIICSSCVYMCVYKMWTSEQLQMWAACLSLRFVTFLLKTKQQCSQSYTHECVPVCFVNFWTAVCAMSTQ